MSESYQRIVQALEDHECRVGKQFRCPAHDDKTPSLSVNEGRDGRVLVKCHAGCTPGAIVDALGLTMVDLFEGGGDETARRTARHVATYEYVDEEGHPLYQVCRYDPKGFRQRRSDGNGVWTWNLNGVRRLLYRLPQVLEAARAGETIYVVEGEKDVESIEALGAVATCNPGGAGKWCQEYSRSLFGASCRVVADRDKPGRRHAREVAASLRAADVSVEILQPASGNDVSDHLESGRGLEDLLPLQDEGHAPDEAIDRDGFHMSDTGNANLFAEMHGRDVRFDFRRKCWFVWTGHHWARDVDGKLVRLAEGVARKRYQDAWDISDKEEARKASKFALDSENRTRVMAMLELARSREPIAHGGEEWDLNPMLLGVPNGVVDLRSGELRNGCRDDRITLLAGAPYNPKAACNRWLRFLHEVFDGDEDLIDFVQRAVGYSLTGDVSEQCLFLLYGTGANGKSTFLNALHHAAGAYGHTMPFSTLEMDQRSAIPNDLAALVGRRFVTASETNEATRLNEGRVKALTGGDALAARFLHREFFTYRPVAKFWLAVNHKPRVTDDSHGFWRRVRLIPFTQQFAGDKSLEGQLLAEGQAILQWIVQGGLAWQKRGLDPPDCVLNATEEYRRESDLLEEFIAEYIEVVDGETALPVRDIVAAYGVWADHEGLKGRERLGSRSLRSRLKARWPERHRPAVRKTPTRYLGLRLRGGDA